MSKVELLSITPDAAKHIELCARHCYASEDKITEDSYEGFLRGCIKRGHLSILSHACASFRISEMSRACSHQMVRAMFVRVLQRSQRYNKEINSLFVIPETIASNIDALDRFLYGQKIAQKVYSDLLDMGIPKEDARYSLTEATHTSMCITSTFQGFYDNLILRLGRTAQWEVKDIYGQIYKILNKECPSIFNEELLTHQAELCLDFPDELSVTHGYFGL